MRGAVALLGLFMGVACSSPKAEVPVLASQEARVLTTSPSFIRTGFTQTVLADGRVLLVGGTTAAPGAPSDFRACELYTPGASTPWSATGNLVKARHEHAATRLSDGRVLVSGGITPRGDGRNAELYDPTTGTWSETGPLQVARARHTQTLLPNGKVLVVGGDNPASAQGLASAELFDPATGTWALTAAPTHTYSGHTATLLKQGDVLVLGNRLQHERYNPTANTWSAVANSGNVLASGHSATLLTKTDSGLVLVVGPRWINDVPEQRASFYDPVTNTWAFGAVSVVRTGHAAVELSNGSVLVVGGIHPTTGTPVTSAERYNIGATGWTVMPALALARRDFKLSLIASSPDKVLINGGWNRDSGGVLSRQPSELYSTGCVPATTCSAIGGQCGTPPDGCGGSLSCGACAAGSVCNSQFMCESTCQPSPSNCIGLCGCVPNGCGVVMNCGTCADAGPACPAGQQRCCDGSCGTKNECLILACASSSEPVHNPQNPCDEQSM
ncbi:Kelch repeat-containing protein [Corallococcus terminator]